jgi:hypothetical protein
MCHTMLTDNNEEVLRHRIIVDFGDDLHRLGQLLLASWWQGRGGDSCCVTRCRHWHVCWCWRCRSQIVTWWWCCCCRGVSRAVLGQVACTTRLKHQAADQQAPQGAVLRAARALCEVMSVVDCCICWREARFG